MADEKQENIQYCLSELLRAPEAKIHLFDVFDPHKGEFIDREFSPAEFLSHMRAHLGYYGLADSSLFRMYEDALKQVIGRLALTAQRAEMLATLLPGSIEAEEETAEPFTPEQEPESESEQSDEVLEEDDLDDEDDDEEDAEDDDDTQ